MIASIKTGVPAKFLMANLAEAITEGMFHASMKEKMSALETQKADLEPILLHPRLAEVYADKIRQLITTLNEPALRLEATKILRSLIDKLVLIPDARDGYSIDLQGDLGALLNMATSATASTANGPESRPLI